MNNYSTHLGKYYVYELHYPDDLEVFGRAFAGKTFYVGKGVGSRADQHEANTRATLLRKHPMKLKHKDKIILSIWDMGFEVVKKIVFRSDDENDVLDKEAELIQSYGLQLLSNAVPGRRSRTPAGKEANENEPGQQPAHQGLHGIHQAGGATEIPGRRQPTQPGRERGMGGEAGRRACGHISRAGAITTMAGDGDIHQGARERCIP